jgi:hypothetical protein
MFFIEQSQYTATRSRHWRLCFPPFFLSLSSSLYGTVTVRGRQSKISATGYWTGNLYQRCSDKRAWWHDLAFRSAEQAAGPKLHSRKVMAPVLVIDRE